MAKIEVGEMVIVVLREPREKIWGVLHEIGAAGIYVRGIDLNAYEEMLRAIRNKEDFYGLGSLFFPLWRVERVSKDERNGDIPSLAEQFESQTGVMIAEI